VRSQDALSRGPLLFRKPRLLLPLLAAKCLITFKREDTMILLQALCFLSDWVLDAAHRR